MSLGVEIIEKEKNNLENSLLVKIKKPKLLYLQKSLCIKKWQAAFAKSTIPGRKSQINL